MPLFPEDQHDMRPADEYHREMREIDFDADQQPAEPEAFDIQQARLIVNNPLMDRACDAIAKWQAEAERLSAGWQADCAIAGYFTWSKNMPDGVGFTCAKCGARVDANGNGDHTDACVTTAKGAE